MHTFTSIYVHVVFATWNRKPVLDPSPRQRLHAYLAASARNLGLESVTVGGVEDHLHFIARFPPAEAISSVIGILKTSSTDWLRNHYDHLSGFRWQRGYGGFSVSVDRIAAVRRYIEKQEEHHQRRSFGDELELLLREFGVSPADLNLL